MIKATSILLVLIFLVFCCFGFVVWGQSEIVFTPADNFDIPLNNASIRFGVDGTYENASLENNIWNFINLRLNNTQYTEKLGLRISAKDCNVTINSCFVYNRTLPLDTTRRARIRYDFVGDGSQVFDLGFDPTMGHWEVVVNGEYIAENRRWSFSSDGLLTVIGESANVSLSYFGLPNSNVDHSFFDQHSTVIITSSVVIVVVIVSIAIKKSKKQNNSS
ncbi:hypothetical protein MUO66_09980 [Candidatus Bathyarchaeota archaeon]|nr:hypothetical protein [Candidatus Bathyarchaeota archaeon]